MTKFCCASVGSLVFLVLACSSGRGSDTNRPARPEDTGGNQGGVGAGGAAGSDNGGSGGPRESTARSDGETAADPTPDAGISTIPDTLTIGQKMDALPPVPLFVAAGNGGLRAVSNDGVTWKDVWLSAGNVVEAKDNFRGIGYGGGTFLAVGGAFGENILMKSRDGIQWDTLVAPSFGGLYDAAYDNGTWVISGSGADRGYSDDEGKTWTRTGDNVGAHFRILAAGGGKFLAVGNTWENPERGITSVSSDRGRSWSKGRNTNDGAIIGVAYGAGTFVTVSKNRCERSVDGLLWQPCGDSPGRENNGVYFANGTFVIVKSDGGRGQRSENGAVWTDTVGSVPAGSLSHAGGIYVVVQWSNRFHSKTLGSFVRVNTGFRPAGSAVSNW